MPFGASTSSIEELLPGQNTLIVLSGDVKPPDIRMLSEILTVDKSTRLLALGPVNVLNPLILPASRWYMELARIDSGFPFLTTDFSNEGIVPSASPVSIILCLNRRSLVLDPIDWFGLRNDLIEWADSKNIHIVIPKLTDARFRERLIPSSNTRPGIIKNPAPSVLHFFDGRVKRSEETRHLLKAGVSLHAATLINKINKHDPVLSALGILPNHIRQLMKGSVNDINGALLDLSKTLFWKGYHIWKKRRSLVSQAWKSWPPEWNVHGTKRNKRTEINGPSCSDPFHFFPKHVNLSKLRRTPCNCSKTTTSESASMFYDIRDFGVSLSQVSPLPPPPKPKPVPCRSTTYLTHEDLIRFERDRAFISA